MDFDKALERKNLRMKEAIWAKHMDFENALRFKRQMFERSRPLIYQRSSDDLPTELVKLLWPRGVKYEETAMQQSLIQVFAHQDMDKEFDMLEDLRDYSCYCLLA
ncbi:hypothetical protein Tco_1330297 [Tanacetum coccineum]